MIVLNDLFTVKTWTGEVKPVKKIVLFPEIDQSGDIFYKIEGQLNLDYFMIDYSYNHIEAKEKYLTLLDELIEYQIKSLQEN